MRKPANRSKNLVLIDLVLDFDTCNENGKGRPYCMRVMKKIRILQLEDDLKVSLAAWADSKSMLLSAFINRLSKIGAQLCAILRLSQ